MLPDGRVVVPVYDGELTVFCYEAGSTTALDWTYNTGYEQGWYSDVCVLTNGNIVVMWPDYNDDRPYFIILNSDGGVVQYETDCDPGANYDVQWDEPVHVLALADGGFYCYWIEDSTYPAGSVWDSDGSPRSVSGDQYHWYDSTIEPAAPIQMPTGGVGAYSGWFIIS